MAISVHILKFNQSLEIYTVENLVGINIQHTQAHMLFITQKSALEQHINRNWGHKNTGRR